MDLETQAILAMRLKIFSASKNTHMPEATLSEALVAFLGPLKKTLLWRSPSQGQDCHELELVTNPVALISLTGWKGKLLNWRLTNRQKFRKCTRESLASREWLNSSRNQRSRLLGTTCSSMRLLSLNSSSRVYLQRLSISPVSGRITFQLHTTRRLLQAAAESLTKPPCHTYTTAVRKTSALATTWCLPMMRKHHQSSVTTSNLGARSTMLASMHTWQAMSLLHCLSALR